MNIEQPLNVILRNKELFTVFSGEEKGKKSRISCNIILY